jgi:hypothetical protein
MAALSAGSAASQAGRAFDTELAARLRDRLAADPIDDTPPHLATIARTPSASA